MPDFQLDPRLAGDTLVIGDLALSGLLLMNESTYCWAILVPRRSGLTEIIDLDRAAQGVLMEEIAAVSAAIRAIAAPLKINVGALGNIVRQLHVHVLARHEGDPAWPGPVWGKAPPKPYEPAKAAEIIARFRAELAPHIRIS
ncbi:HIT domain-containing protein [Oryzibacter oryziterrae]|uniref:HIT domain-containing protein n=1 Tax=Oryzibacter oryziterrae TaxID=2766474 RepID=UPI001F463704|nr:HIT family protein [Oryzibacter oryziterrae]